MAEVKTKYIPLIRLYAVKEEGVPYGGDKIQNPLEVVEVANKILKDVDREHMLAISVNTKGNPVGVEIIAIGSLNKMVIEPREVFKYALLSNAAAMILVHNHPSGDTTPSSEDISATKRIQQAGNILGIPLHDHVIIGIGYYSFRENSLLDMVDAN